MIGVSVDFIDDDMAGLLLLVEVDVISDAELGILNLFMAASPSRLAVQTVEWLV
jgi:hypothetical protein